MQKEELDQVVKVGGQHLANLVTSNAKNIEKAYDDLVAKGGGEGKASLKVGLHLLVQKNLEGKAGGVKVSAGISGKTTFKDSTAPETIDTHPKLPGIGGKK